MPTLTGNVEILMKPQGQTKREVPAGIGTVIQSEYASKYLELIGVNPCRENVELVLRNLPISECLVLGVWARGSLLVLPGMAKKAKEGPNILKELFGVHDDEDDVYYTMGDKNSASDPTKVNETLLTEDEENEAARLSSVIGKYAYIQVSNRKLPGWNPTVTSNLLSPLDKGVPNLLLQNEDFLDLLRPPFLDETHIGKPLFTFAKSLLDYVPRVKEDRSLATYEAIKKFLQVPACIKLYGALVHYLYWNAIRKFVDDVTELSEDENFMDKMVSKSLDRKDSVMSSPSQTKDMSTSTSIEKELLNILYEKAVLKLKTSLGYSKFSLVTGHQSLICCCHFVVDQLMEFSFPWLIPAEKRLQQKQKNHNIKLFGVDKEMDILRSETRKMLHKLLVDVIDPTRIYSHNLLISSFLGENLSGGKSKKPSQFTTSIGVKEIFSEYAQDASTRKILSHTKGKGRRLPVLSSDNNGNSSNNIKYSNNRSGSLSPLRAASRGGIDITVTGSLTATDRLAVTRSTSHYSEDDGNEEYLDSANNNRLSTVTFNLTHNPSVDNTNSPIRSHFRDKDLLSSLKNIREAGKTEWYSRPSTSKLCDPTEANKRIEVFLGIQEPPPAAKPSPSKPLDFKNLFISNNSNISSKNNNSNKNNNSSCYNNINNNFSNHSCYSAGSEDKDGESNYNDADSDSLKKISYKTGQTDNCQGFLRIDEPLTSSPSHNRRSQSQSQMQTQISLTSSRISQSNSPIRSPSTSKPPPLLSSSQSQTSFQSRDTSEKMELFQLIVKRAQASYESNGNGGLPADKCRYSLLDPAKHYK